MCILFATRAHPDYKLILLSNRDEFFERKTHATCWNHDGFILSPYDMAIEKKGQGYGTWLGINRRGIIAVILNLKIDSPLDSESVLVNGEPRSRGIVPLQFLQQEDNAPFDNWDSWEKFNGQHGNLRRTGPFTLFYGDAKSDEYNVIDYLKHSTNPFEKMERMVISNDIFHCAVGEHTSRWNKTEYGYVLLDALAKNTTGIAKEELLQKCFELLSNHTFNEGEDVDSVTTSSIYVPPLRITKGADAIGTSLPIGDYYGTRSQIVILVDKDNRVTYEEHVIYESDEDCETYSFMDPKEVIQFQFNMES